jgi:hypothetical protein
MPSLLSTSRTSPLPDVTARFRDDLDGVRASPVETVSLPVIHDPRSNVEIDAGLARAGLDLPLRPSRASLRSVTPTPRVDLAKLWREMFSPCIKAGDILRRGETPSPLPPPKVEGFSTAESQPERQQNKRADVTG